MNSLTITRNTLVARIIHHVLSQGIIGCLFVGQTCGKYSRSKCFTLPSSPPATVFISPRHRRHRTRCMLRMQSLVNGIVYLFLSWFGLIALIRSLVNQQTIGPIVLVVGITLSEECLRLLPARHNSAVLFGLFPSIAGERKCLRRHLGLHKTVFVTTFCM